MNHLNSHPSEPSRSAAIAYLSLAMAMWAIMETVAAFFTQHYATFQIVWMRYTIHLLFMLVVFGPRARLRLVRTRRLGLQFLRGLLMMGMHLSFIFAVRRISARATMSAFWIAPLLLLVLSTLRKERPDWLHWLLTLAGLASVLVILRPLDALSNPASLLSLSMALCFVLYMQISRAMPGEDILASLFYTALSVWIVLSFFMPFYWVKPAPVDLLIFAAIGLVGWVGIYGFDKAAELAPTWVSAPFGYIQPLLIMLAEWFFHDRFPGRLSLGAAFLVLIYLGLLAWRKNWIRLIPGYNHA